MPESGSRWVKNLLAESENSVYISEITLPEVIAAIAGNSRAPQGISVHLRDKMWTLFLDDCRTNYQSVGITRKLIEFAVQLARRRKLRGCDAIQLATAIVLNTQFLKQDFFLTLVAADDDLLEAAMEEGLSIINPEAISESKKHD